VWAFGYNSNEVIFVAVINIETHNPLAALLDKGEGFLIAMGDKPVAKVMPYATTNQETTLDEQLSAAIEQYIKRNNIPVTTLEVNEKGHLIIDKVKHPHLYDWAVNG